MKDYLYPFWRGEITHCESFLPLYDKDCTDTSKVTVKTLFPIETIISITDSAKQKTYSADKDYFLADGVLTIPADSDIQIMSWEEYNPEIAPPEAFIISCTLGGYLRFGETGELTGRQYLITYTHKESSQNYDTIFDRLPENRLPRFKKRMNKKEPFTFGFFGDSITVGANSSGFAPINQPPYQPIFTEMVCEYLSEQGVNAKHVNKAVGGTTSGWGVEEYEKAYAEDVPDLLLLAFGMNDGSGRVTGETFIDNITAIMEKALTANPDTEFLLVSTMLPNSLASGFYGTQDEYEPLLRNLADCYGERAALVPFSSVHHEMVRHKNYADMTGNNVNHPNDFLAGAYAQAIIEVLMK